VVMWWDLDMDGSGTNYISMAPTWIDSNSAVGLLSLLSSKHSTKSIIVAWPLDAMCLFSACSPSCEARRECEAVLCSRRI
jgi:hypothetical protein